MILSIASSLTIETAFAEIPKPSTPQFTAKYISGPISLPLDPFTGTNSTTVYERGAIELSINNQKYTYSNGSTFSLYYNVKIKNPSIIDSTWQELFPTIKLFPEYANLNIENYGSHQADYISGVNTLPHPILPQSNISSTTVYLPILSPNAAYKIAYIDSGVFPAYSQMNIQVAVMLGVNSTHYIPDNSIVNAGGTNYPAVAYVMSSDWSDIQTIAIGDVGSTVAPSSIQSSKTRTDSSSQNPAITPIQSNSGTLVLFSLGWWQLAVVVLLGVIVVLLVFVVVFLRRRALR